MARNYVELHPLPGQSVLLKIIAPITRDDDNIPVFAPPIQVLETTNRVDGPFTPGKLYNSQTDSVLPAPPIPAPTAEQLAFRQLQADDAADQPNVDMLLAKDHTTWTADEKTLVDKIILRRLELQRFG